MARHTISVRVEVEVDTDQGVGTDLDTIRAVLASQARQAIEPDASVVRILHAASVLRRER